MAFINSNYFFLPTKAHSNTVFRQCTANSLEFLHWWLSTSTKWLKDRKGRALDFEDILHYQKIIVALTETSRIMLEIDAIEIK